MAARPIRSSLLPWLSLATLVVVVDQVAKAAVSRSLRLGDTHRLTDWLNIVCWHNTGAAFSFLHDASGWQRWLFVALAVAAVVFIVWMLSRHGAQRLFSTALALILGGAVGNVIDRVLNGYVVDFIQVHYGSAAFPAFNVADSAITLGAALLILDELTRVRRAR
jgi:signal peptidase II